MSSWLHRVDKTFIARSSPTDMKLRYPTEIFVDVNGNAVSNINWIWKPDLGAVGNFASKYWVIAGDAVSLMDQAARDAVDAQEAASEVAEDRAENKLRIDDERVLKALALVMLDEINLLRSKHSLAPRTKAQLITAIKAKVDTI